MCSIPFYQPKCIPLNQSLGMLKLFFFFTSFLNKCYSVKEVLSLLPTWVFACKRILKAQIKKKKKYIFYQYIWNIINVGIFVHAIITPQSPTAIQLRLCRMVLQLGRFRLRTAEVGFKDMRAKIRHRISGMVSPLSSWMFRSGHNWPIIVRGSRMFWNDS